MKVRVKLFATLRNGRFEEELREYGAQTRADQVLVVGFHTAMRLAAVPPSTLVKLPPM